MRKVVFLILSVAFAMGTSTCYAQDSNRRQEKGAWERRRVNPKERIEKLIEYLELDETQAAQFRVVMEEQQKQMMEELHESSAILNGERPTEEQIQQFRAKMAEKQQAINTVLQIILTKEQFEKYRKLTERRGLN